jgi:hypothetical protein
MLQLAIRERVLSTTKTSEGYSHFKNNHISIKDDHAMADHQECETSTQLITSMN